MNSWILMAEVIAIRKFNLLDTGHIILTRIPPSECILVPYLCAEYSKIFSFILCVIIIAAQ